MEEVLYYMLGLEREREAGSGALIKPIKEWLVVDVRGACVRASKKKKKKKSTKWRPPKRSSFEGIKVYTTSASLLPLEVIVDVAKSKSLARGGVGRVEKKNKKERKPAVKWRAIRARQAATAAAAVALDRKLVIRLWHRQFRVSSDSPSLANSTSVVFFLLSGRHPASILAVALFFFAALHRFPMKTSSLQFSLAVNDTSRSSKNKTQNKQPTGRLLKVAHPPFSIERKYHPTLIRESVIQVFEEFWFKFLD